MQKKVIYAASAGVVVLLALAVLIVNIYSNYKEKNTPSDQVMELSSYYNIADGEAMIILDGDVYDRTALHMDGTNYIDIATVTEMYTHRFFDQGDMVIYTTPSEVYHFVPGSKDFTLNDEAYTSSVPCVQRKGEELYIAVDFLERCGITYKVFHEPERLMITYSEDSYLAVTSTDATQIRVSQSIKADILKEVAAGDQLRIIDGGGIRQDGFIKVMSADGVRGYIKEAALSDTFYADPVFTPYTPEVYTHNRYSEPVFLGWQLLYTKDSLGYLSSAVKKAPEMNVIAPTWFYLTGTEGDFLSYATHDYVDKAHEAGLKVWATYKNDYIEGQFNGTEDTHTILSAEAGRRRMIDNILASVEEYDLDGINIDYEMLKLDSGIYFIQFLRELSVKCRALGIVLSVDNYVPENYNAYYNLKEQAFLVDYIVIMGYDEHYAGSGEAGSVASLGWFTRAIEGTLAKAAPEGVIMGLPFYTRLWKETSDGLSVEAAPGMDEAAKKVKAAKAELIWKEAEGQHYAEYTSSGALYKIWLEDFDSITCKVAAIHDAGLAGVAAWKLGDETEGTWALIKDIYENGRPEPAEEIEEEQNGNN